MAITVPAMLLAMEAARMGMAASEGKSFQTARLREAISMDPANPAFDERLGLVESYSFNGGSGRRGLVELRRAVALSPDNTPYWANLASACEALGELGCSNQGVGRTLALSPMTPRYRWMAANYYLRQNRLDASFRQFRRLLELDSSYASPVFRLCLKATGEPEQIEDKVVPAGHPGVEFAYVNFLIAKGNEDFAGQVWNKIAASRASFPFSLAEPYLDHLIAAGREPQAVSMWSDLERLGVVGDPAPREPGNLVFNGGFEQTPLNAGFDWRYQEEPYVRVSFRDPGAYQGARCLRVDFTFPKNRGSEPVYQVIPVEPNQAYRLTAAIRSLEVTSDSGPRLRVMDPDCSTCLNAETASTVGTTPWHKLTLNFATGPNTHLIRLSVWRRRSYTFPPQITGSFWLDDVSVKAIQPAAGQASAKP
jgi:hypothetical protein